MVDSSKTAEEKNQITDFYFVLLREFDYLLNYELAFKIAHMAQEHFVSAGAAAGGERA